MRLAESPMLRLDAEAALWAQHQVAAAAVAVALAAVPQVPAAAVQ